MTIESEIERQSFEALEIQKKASANVRKADGDWNAAEEDCYTMGFETGARWAFAYAVKVAREFKQQQWYPPPGCSETSCHNAALFNMVEHLESKLKPGVGK